MRAEVNLGSHTVSVHSHWRLLSASDWCYANWPHGDHKLWVQVSIFTIGSTKPNLTIVLRTSFWEMKTAMGGLAL